MVEKEPRRKKVRWDRECDKTGGFLINQGRRLSLFLHCPVRTPSQIFTALFQKSSKHFRTSKDGLTRPKQDRFESLGFCMSQDSGLILQTIQPSSVLKTGPKADTGGRKLASLLRQKEFPLYRSLSRHLAFLACPSYRSTSSNSNKSSYVPFANLRPSATKNPMRR